MPDSAKDSYISWLRRYVGQRRIFMIGSMAAVRDDAGRVLVMRRADNGEWDFPGGAMELGETLASALVREVSEETGLVVEPVRLVGVYTSPKDHDYTYPNGDQVQGWAAFFECRAVDGSLQAQDGEASELAFVPPDELGFGFPVLDRMKADLLAEREEAAFDPFSTTAGPTGEYYAFLRAYVGHAPLLLPGTAACIRDAQGRVLLQRRADSGLWCFPGGGQNLGESAAHAIVREVYEETGLRVEPTRLIGVLSESRYARIFDNGDRTQPVTAFFEAKRVGGDLRSDSAETLELGYFPIRSLPPMLPCCQFKATQAFSGRREASFHYVPGSGRLESVAACQPPPGSCQKPPMPV
jgi:ADP-ribose pyrophosphatase YjhB (NUDIX family)